MCALRPDSSLFNPIRSQPALRGQPAPSRPPALPRYAAVLTSGAVKSGLAVRPVCLYLALKRLEGFQVPGRIFGARLPLGLQDYLQNPDFALQAGDRFEVIFPPRRRPASAPAAEPRRKCR